MLQLARRAKFARGLRRFVACGRFSPPRNKPVVALGGVYSASCPKARRSEAREICWAAWKPAKGELRSPDKLKHVPRKRPKPSGERSSPVDFSAAHPELLAGLDKLKHVPHAGRAPDAVGSDGRQPPRPKRCTPAKFPEEGKQHDERQRTEGMEMDRLSPVTFG